MLEMDGSQGEGGGQILRSSLALALVTGRAVRVRNIRAGRAKPGLMRQHLTAVQAAARVGQAHVQGAELGAMELVFEPGRVRAGEYHFAVGSAGSATLVLQTVLPPLLRAAGPSTLRLEGGTHNTHAPPYDFLDQVFAPLVRRVFASRTDAPPLAVTLVRPGFYPVGGGEVRATVHPGGAARPLELVERGRLLRRSAHAVVSRLPASIAERELGVIKAALDFAADELQVTPVADARGPGNVVMIGLEFEQVSELVTAFGARGVRAEQVAQDAVEQARAYLASDAPVGAHLADQLLLPLALGGGGVFRTAALTEHTRTNLDVLRTFLEIPLEATPEPTGGWRVRVA